MDFTYEALEEMFEVDVPEGIFKDPDGYWQREVSSGLGMAVKHVAKEADPELGPLAHAIVNQVVVLTQMTYLHGMQAQEEADNGQAS